MKEIYVYKKLLGGWTGISKEEAEAKVKDGSVSGAEIEMDRDNGETLKIILLEDNFLMFGYGDEKANRLIEEYLKYVEEITGMVTERA